MKKICETMALSPLFAGLDHDIYHVHCENTPIHTFWKGQLIVMEGDLCKGIGIVIEGRIARQKYTPSGEFTTLELLGEGSVFGEDLIFSTQKQFSYSLEALTHVKAIQVSREDILALISKSPRLLLNYLALLSDRSLEQDRRIHLLSQKTLRLKISGYLLALLEEKLTKEGKMLREALEGSAAMSVELPVSKEVVARLLAMPRPSFSRELISMEKDGLVRVDGRVVWLEDIQGLACGLYEDCGVEE
ncbi:MAG TPA: Crp/Fnr family transcriptional regulator [Clostridiaceae bacterium]|nr:Crp/Fnr family transcriptional regulator [Clostridiaceae bacterium]